MVEKSGNDEALTERLFTLEIGSAESRAVARRLVQQRKRAPNLIFIFVNPRPRDSEGRPTGPVELGSKTATIEGSDKKLIREEAESQESFERRVADELPAVGLPGLAYLCPDDIPPAA